MRIIGLSFRRGTSTVFGTIIFIGIMFTAVIPMFLFMRQADTLHEMRKYELTIMDEERAREEIFFHLETEIVDEPIITLKINNRGALAVRITRVWINDEPRPVDYFLPPISQSEFELVDLIDPESPDPVSFSLMIVTDQGSLFAPYSPNPTYDPILGGSWEHDFYRIYIMMTNLESQLHIFVTLVDPPEVCFDYDVDNNKPGYRISVPAPGQYQVVVTKLLGMPNQEILIDTTIEVSSDFPTALVIL